MLVFKLTCVIYIIETVKSLRYFQLEYMKELYYILTPPEAYKFSICCLQVFDNWFKPKLNSEAMPDQTLEKFTLA